MRSLLRPSVALLALALAPLPAAAQPQIDLPPPSPDEPAPAIPKPPSLALPRENQIDVPLFGSPTAATTAIGGYGELTLNVPFHGDDPAVADVRRLVLFFGHNFTDSLRFYSELELEHAVSSADDRGEMEVEQAFLDYLALRPYLNVRAGLIIMPVGIVNVFHEPPMFNGVDRPLTDQVVIPSTWRELGAGLFGGVGALRWQAYVVTSFDALGFTADTGVRDGHQEGQLARASDWAGVVRLDWEPRLGIDLGVSLYRGDSGQGQHVDDPAGNPLPVGAATLSLVEGDARARWKGLSARFEIASIWIGEADKLDAALVAQALAAHQEAPPAVASQLWGGYLEVAYDVLHPLGERARGVALDLFGRYEHVDTQAALPAGYAKDVAQDREILTFGATLHPIPEIAVKLDYQRWFDGTEASWNQLNAGIGFMY